MKLLYFCTTIFLILIVPTSFAQNIVNIDFSNTSDDDASDNLNNIKLLSVSENKKSDEFNLKVVSISNGTENVYFEQKVSRLSKLNLSLENGKYKFYISKQNDTSVIEYNNNSNGYVVSSNSIIILQYPQYEGYILDVPWRIQSSEKYFPILAISKDRFLPDIHNISVYDALNNDSLIETTNWGEKHNLYFGGIPYFYLFRIDKSKFLKNENNQISVKLKFDLEYADLIPTVNWEGPINTTLSNEDIPRTANWFYGDTHVHSNYTDNPYEYGAPVYATSEAINAIGLSWVTITDHSFDQTNLSTNWDDYLRACNADKRCLPAEEVSCDWGAFGYYSHYLYYNASTFMDGAEIYWGDTKTCAENIARINNVGFGYVAHPEHNDRLRVEWQNYSLPFTGLEVWNSIGDSWEKERDAAIQKWILQLLLGRHIFISAGSDAHGDFNSALGKVRTACFAENFTKDNIFTALKSGNCMMTDGPIVIFTANNHIIGESFNVLRGNNITLNISWNSTNEFGNVTEIILIRGEINGTEINETILLPDNLSGSAIVQSVPNNTYYRIEAKSIDSEGKVRRAYTNPIWVRAEPVPELQKIPMDETEHALVSAFENKYDYPLKDLFFDAEPNLECKTDALQKNLGLNNSWTVPKCEKMFLNNTRLMWAAFNNSGGSERRIMLQTGGRLIFSNATYNEFSNIWAGCCFGSPYGLYVNNNWIADENGREIFEINEIHNTNWAGGSYFGTYLIHGFGRYDGNTVVYYSHWGPEQVNAYNIHNIYLNFDNLTYPFIYEGFAHDTSANFNRAIFQSRLFNHNASIFRLGADGEYRVNSQVFPGNGVDNFTRKIYPVLQTEFPVQCHADVDCNDRNLSTKDACINSGTTESVCEHTPQEFQEERKPYTEMDADEVSKVIGFRNKYNKSLNEIYFDGQANTDCNNTGILETLRLNASWSVSRCKKFLINGSLAMFAALSNGAGEQYLAYQLGNILIDESAAYTAQSGEFQRTTVAPSATFTYYLDSWTGIKNNTIRFKIAEFGIKRCQYPGCSDIIPYATYIFHGFGVNGNKDTQVLYSFKKEFSKEGNRQTWENSPFINVLFDNYKKFGMEGESNESVYALKPFNYRALTGWSLVAGNFYYWTNNASIFPPYRANEIFVELESPAHMLINDSFGRLAGYFNGNYVNEIPGAKIIGTAHEKYLLPAGANYRIFVQGYETGSYGLKITAATNESEGILHFKNISATNATSDVFEFNDAGNTLFTTSDSSKTIYLSLENIHGNAITTNVTLSEDVAATIRILDWSTLNNSVTLTETVSYPPEIIAIHPENMSVFEEGAMLPISINATDANNDTLEYSILFDGIEISRENGANYNLNETGKHAITFNVSDGANSVSYGISISVVAQPNITIIFPQNETYVNRTIFLNASFGSVIDTAWISIDGAANQTYTRSVSEIASGLDNLPDGPHNIRIYANNSVGTVNSSITYFTIDTAPPIIAIISPANGTSFPPQTKYIWINITTNEDAVCRYNTSNSSFNYPDGIDIDNTGGLNHSFLYAELSNKQMYMMYYKCSDTYGNTNDLAALHTFGVFPPGLKDGAPPHAGGGGGGGDNKENKTKVKDKEDKDEKDKDSSPTLKNNEDDKRKKEERLQNEDVLNKNVGDLQKNEMPSGFFFKNISGISEKIRSLVSWILALFRG